eukprot:scaffold5860_cov103-Isochrysis_galbana.AAC.5
MRRGGAGRREEGGSGGSAGSAESTLSCVAVAVLLLSVWTPARFALATLAISRRGGAVRGKERGSALDKRKWREAS